MKSHVIDLVSLANMLLKTLILVLFVSYTEKILN